MGWAGVPGGFSYTGGVTQITAAGGRQPVLVLSADAAAFTDDERRAAWESLSLSGPVQVNRLYEFSAADLARIFVEIWPEVVIGLGLNLSASAIWDGLKHLFSKREAPTTIEIRRHYADGRETKAIVTTADPEIAKFALENLDEEQRPTVVVFDPADRSWKALDP